MLKYYKNVLFMLLLAALFLPPLWGDEEKQSSPSRTSRSEPVKPEQTAPQVKDTDKGQDCILITDYLPNIMYVDETVTAVLRIRNRGVNTASCELYGVVGMDDTEKIGVEKRACLLPPGTEQQFTLNVPITRGKKKIVMIQFSLKVDGKKGTELPPILLYRNYDPLPSFSLSDGTYFTTDSGERVIFLIEHRVYKEDRKWLIPRLFKSGISGKKYDSFFLLAPMLTGKESEKDSYIKKVLSKNQNADFLRFDDFPSEGAYPILRNVYLFSKDSTEVKKQRVVFIFSNSDLLLGTGKREFRMCVEFLVQRLEKKGYKDYLIVGPMYPYHQHETFQPYIDQLKKVSKAYSIPMVSPELAGPEYWELPGKKGSTLGRYPNSKGHKALAEFLNDAIKK